LYAIRDDVSGRGFQLRNMDDGVNGVHTVWKTKSIGLFSDLSNNRVGSEILV